MGDDFKGVEKEGSNGAVPWDDVQISGKDSAAVWQQKFVGDRGNVEYPGGVSPPGGQTDHGDDGNICGGRKC